MDKSVIGIELQPSHQTSNELPSKIEGLPVAPQSLLFFLCRRKSMAKR
jgi:hypothetical protein